MDDFWSWLHSDDLAHLLTPHQIELDLTRMLTAGDSAGGMLSIYLALTYPDQIRAATAGYPLLSWDNPPLHPQIRSWMNPEVPESYLNKYLANIQPGQIESSDLDLKRIRLQSAISQHKRGPELYARDSENSPCRERLFQLAGLDQPDTKLPRGGLVIMHGVDDGMVVPLASGRFVEKARATMQGRQGGKNIVLSLRPGDHGFDVNSSLEDEWLKEALKTAVEAWLE